MGYILIPHCNHCNYTAEELFVGTGMKMSDPFAPDLKFPGINKRSNTVGIDNINAPKKSSLHFTFYNQSGMSQPKNANNNVDFSDHNLELENNLCPKCYTYELDFWVVGTWD